MVSKQTGLSRKRRSSTPLTEASLRDLALAYVARFATSSAKLEAYLHRKIRERGVDDDARQIDVRAIVDRIVELKYVDDEAYAQSRTSGLLRKGYGARRVDQDLFAAGIDENLRQDTAPGERELRLAALTLARKRGFGPFGSTHMPGESTDRAVRQKQIAAMVRAGHGFEVAHTIIDAASIEDVEEWVEEADDQ